MKLYISEKVIERRRAIGFTQEDLSQRIGVSAQAISNWERGVGYPDVTMLPSLAAALGISTDELLGVGRLSDVEIFEEFREKLNSISDSNEIKAKMFEYCRAYPNNFLIMELVIWWVYRDFADDHEMTELAKELSKRILNESTDTGIRLTAQKVMAFICDDTEAQRYIDMFDDNILIRPNIIGRRKWDKREYEQSHDWFDLETVLLFRYIIGRSCWCDDSPEKAVKRYELIVDLLKVVGDEEVPEGWLGNYGISLVRLSAALFACGEKQKGYDILEEALAVYEKWYSLAKDRLLSTGRLSLFGNIKFKRTDKNSSVYIGEKEYSYYEIWETDMCDALCADSDWEWFDSVRNEDRFKKIVDKAYEIKN